MFKATDGWPKRIGSLLFTVEDGEPRWLSTADEFFAWACERFAVKWASGVGNGQCSLIPKNEFVAHIQNAAESFASFETAPHEPPRPGAFYTWQPPQDYHAVGQYLDRFVAFFDNAATLHDAALIRAVVISCAWGGRPGARPAFAVIAADRGHGKSNLAASLGKIFGGAISVEPGRGCEDRLVSRLLSPDALSRRVAIVDNMKSFSSALVESLITTSEITGHRLFYGEASRPNTLTWIFTANSPKISRDLADRVFIIRLEKPTPRPGWDDELAEFIDLHRDRIMADAVAALQAKPVAHNGRDRWQSWTDDVLARATLDVEGVLELTRERRGAVDSERDEVELISDTLHDLGDSFVPSMRAVAALNGSLNENRSSKYWAMRIDALVESGQLQGVRRERTGNCKGYSVNV